jgi:hypothetical protein
VAALLGAVAAYTYTVLTELSSLVFQLWVLCITEPSVWVLPYSSLEDDIRLDCKTLGIPVVKGKIFGSVLR